MNPIILTTVLLLSIVLLLIEDARFTWAVVEAK